MINIPGYMITYQCQLPTNVNREAMQHVNINENEGKVLIRRQVSRYVSGPQVLEKQGRVYNSESESDVSCNTGTKPSGTGTYA